MRNNNNNILAHKVLSYVAKVWSEMVWNEDQSCIQYTALIFLSSQGV